MRSCIPTTKRELAKVKAKAKIKVKEKGSLAVKAQLPETQTPEEMHREEQHPHPVLQEVKRKQEKPPTVILNDPPAEIGKQMDLAPEEQNAIFGMSDFVSSFRKGIAPCQRKNALTGIR